MHKAAIAVEGSCVRLNCWEWTGELPRRSRSCDDSGCFS
jgi:hypothetical protein